MAVNFTGKICLDRLLELAVELRGPIESGAEVTLEGASLSAIDFAGIQMLLAAQRRAERTGATLRVRVPQGGALHNALRRYGLADAPPAPFIEAA